MALLINWFLIYEPSITLQACRPKVVATAVNTVITIFKILLQIELWFSLFIVSLGFWFMIYVFCFSPQRTRSLLEFWVLSFLVILTHPVIQRSIATKDLSTSTNSPLERGRGVLECIRFVHSSLRSWHTPCPSLEGSSLAYCHSERSEESEYIHYRFSDPSSLWSSGWQGKEGIN